MYLLQKIPRDYEEKRRSATKGSPIRGCKIKCVSLRREIQNLRTLFLSQSVIR